MIPVPFSLRRPFLLVRYALLRRDQPDLSRLAEIRSPERFVWAVLPHAARSFSASIALLPADVARVSAVGYLYCRMLDTYEDTVADPERREEYLGAFAKRLRDAPPHRPPPPLSELGNCRREKGYHLLLQRCHLVDHVFDTLPEESRKAIRELVRSMGEGMRWSSRVFHEQRGVIGGGGQLSRYCGNVIGRPVIFSLRLTRRTPLTEEEEADAMRVGEYVQLANVTRDIADDLRRGIAYDPRLGPYLGRDARQDPAAAVQVREVRAALRNRALGLVRAYERTFRFLEDRRWSLPRASAMLMLLFTHRHYVEGAVRRGSGGKLAVFLSALPAAASRRWTRRVYRRVAREASALLKPSPSAGRSR